ncbi:MAG: hypothetical protein GXN92_00565 [Candidatus Micrarchaeota archaeon]|nr:hypothetical protein [Candidatus Micrarchaeota archaeon]
MSKQILTRLDEFDPLWIVFQIPTLTGELKEIHISREEISDNIFEEGYDIEGFIGKGEVKLVPRAESYAEVPWYPRTVRFLTYLRESSGVRHPLDLYYPLQKLLKKLDIMIRPAISFHVVEGYTADRVTKERGPSISFDSKEGKWNPVAYYIPQKAYSAFPYDAYYGIRQQIAELLKVFGYGVKKHYHGEGTSQQVISLDAMDGVKAAEAILSLKYISRAIAPAANVQVTYMPYLIPNEPGNFLQLEILGLFQDGELTQEGRYFIGGLLSHYKTLLLFTNPTPNSYKRLLLEPYYRAWGQNVSNVMVNVIKERVVLSFPDAIANPFLAYTAILAAGLDGIKESVDPGDPIKTSPRMLSTPEKRQKKIKEFPKDFLTVIEELESDSEYLKGVLPPELLIEYVEGRYKEIRDNLSQPTAYELERYFHR